ncbi:MAG: hypothetical protein JW747_08990 [Candidatus Aminicenantes bacterium]|nr:hypothetical protein [Candidatus Aminicenantes bacterium]
MPENPSGVSGAAKTGLERKPQVRTALLLTAAFFIIGLVGILRHEIWRDEMQAWLVSKDTVSLDRLWTVALHQKHPVTWYLALKGVSLLSSSPVAMQILHLAIATLSAFLLFAYAPFKIYQKIFLGFGYYFLYEYALISRNYGLGVLSLFAFCALFPRFRRKPLPAAACLFLLANTSVYGLILAGAAGGVLLVEVLAGEELRRKPKFWVALLIIGLGLALCLYQLKPLPTSGYERATPFHTTFNSGLLVDVLILVPRAFLPLPLPILNFWNHPALDHLPAARTVEVLLCLAILAASIALLRRSRPALLFFLLSGAVFFLWFYVGYIGFTRHYGHLFIAFVAALWMAGAAPGRPAASPPVRAGISGSRFLRAGLSVVLFSHFLAGVFAYAMDFSHQFSQARNTARYIRRKGFDGLPIVAHMQGPCVPVAGYLNRPLHYVSQGGLGTFSFSASRRPWGVTVEDVLADAERLCRLHKKDCLIILSLPLLEKAAPDRKNLIRLGRTPPAIVAGEEYFFYLLKFRESASAAFDSSVR